MSESGQYRDGTEHTHYCDDCEIELAVLYDDRDDKSVPLVCGHCWGTNTHSLQADTDR